MITDRLHFFQFRDACHDALSARNTVYLTMYFVSLVQIRARKLSNCRVDKRMAELTYITPMRELWWRGTLHFHVSLENVHLHKHL